MKLVIPITMMVVVLAMAGVAATAPKFRPVAELGGHADISAASGRADAMTVHERL